MAQWVNDGVPVTGLAGNQGAPASASDGAGGVIIAWSNGTGASADIYAQRLGPDGEPLWGPDGVPVCTASGSQYGPVIVASGSGGAIVAWTDLRPGVTGADVYAQVLTGFGIALGTANGIRRTSATGDQIVDAVVTDGAGGAIFAWEDSRSVSGPDVYAGKITSAGGVQWGTNGVALSTATGSQQRIVLASDGSGGAIAAWQDARGADLDIYARRVSSNGTVSWNANGGNGVIVCNATGNQSLPSIVAAAPGGTYISWADARPANVDIYIQSLSSSGASQWTANGVAVCSAVGDQTAPRVVFDLTYGILVASWQDGRSDAGDVYARRVSVSGTPLWTPNGVPLCTAAGGQLTPVPVMAGYGDVAVAWVDGRGGSGTDVYAQAVDTTGAVRYGSNGVKVCGAAGNQDSLAVAYVSGARSIIVTWTDSRAGGLDLYAQRLNSAGIQGFDYSIGSSAGPGGKIIPQGATLVNQGDSQYYAFSPNARSRVKDVLVDNGSIGAPLSHGFSNIAASHTIDVAFDTTLATSYQGWISNGVAMVQGFGSQDQLAMAEDGTGGAFLAWRDSRNASSGRDIYAQRLNASGMPMWAAGGVPVCTASNDQDNPKLVADGTGGAVIIWKKFPSSDIFAQNIGADGTPRWAMNGIAVATGTGAGFAYHTLASDGAGGAIVAWSYSNAGSFDIHAQHVAVSGAVRWTANGVLVSTTDGNDTNPAAVPDGEGGAIVAWTNEGGPDTVFVARVDTSGVVAWQMYPSITAASTINPEVQVAADTRGGALVGWDDNSLGRFHVQRVSHAGVGLWTSDGVPNAPGVYSGGTESLASDGRGGALLAWGWYSGSVGVSCQHIDGSGTKLWGASGVDVCTGCGQTLPGTGIVLEGASGDAAIATWSDSRASSSDINIYARLVSGGIAQWTANGVPLCDASSHQIGPRIVPSGSAIVAWTDQRADSSVFAQRINDFGVVGFDYTITASAGSHGSIFPSGATGVFDGSSQTFLISADPGYRVASVLVDGVFTGSTSSYTFPNLTANHTIAATFSNMPTIALVEPNHGGDNGQISVVIHGAGLQPGATAKFTRSGQPNILGTLVTVSPDSQNVTAVFDLGGKLVGGWDVVVTNPDTTSKATLPLGFTIDAFVAPGLRVDIVPPNNANTMRTNSSTPFDLLIQNPGNVDAFSVPVWMAGIPTNATVGFGFDLADPPRDAGEPDWSLVPDTLTSAGGRYLVLVIPRVPPGAITRRVWLTVPSAPSPPPFQLTAALTPPWIDGTKLRGCLSDGGVITAPACVGARLDSINAYLQAHPELEAMNGFGIWAKVAYPCEGATLPAVEAVARNVLGLMIRPVELLGSIPPSCNDVLGARWRDVVVVTPGGSFDPNDKSGLHGFGSAISPNTILSYTVRFENTTGTHVSLYPANRVLVTDVLVASLSASTVEFGDIYFGSSTVPAVRPSTPSGSKTVDVPGRSDLKVIVTWGRDGSLLTWSFVTVYASTLQPLPTYSTDGFLPPNGLLHEGEGSVQFKVIPAVGNGTQISNFATITFDAEAPVPTGSWLNSIDASPPSSQVVQTTDPQSGTSLGVTWAAVNSPDIKDYTIYVKQDNGAYWAWRTDISATSATSDTLVPPADRHAHTYYLYSSARDMVGNIELAPSPPPDATNNWIVGVEETRSWRLALEGARPNPAVDGVRAWFTLPNADPATLELIDIAGRRVAKREVGSMGPGPHLVTLGQSPRLRSGLYFLRLVQGGRALHSRVVMLR